MVDTIFFDLDNTVLDFSMAEKIALTKTLGNIGIDVTEEILATYRRINQAQWKLLEQGKLTREQVLLRRFELLFDKFDMHADVKAAAEMYEKLLEIGHYFIDGADEVIPRLSTICRLYILTNGSASVQRSRMASADFDRYFKDMFISEEIGFNKPGREYFDHCFERIPDFKRERCVIIGDSLTSDIQGGINAGIKTIWFNPSFQEKDADVEPDYEIHHLREIEDLIKIL